MASRFLQWETWLYGLVSAAIGGGASAVTATVTASMIAPDKFNLGGELHNVLLLAGATFGLSGFLSAMAFLAKSPLPGIGTQQTVEVEQTAVGGVKVTATTTDKPPAV